MVEKVMVIEKIRYNNGVTARVINKCSRCKWYHNNLVCCKN